MVEEGGTDTERPVEVFRPRASAALICLVNSLLRKRGSQRVERERWRGRERKREMARAREKESERPSDRATEREKETCGVERHFPPRSKNHILTLRRKRRKKRRNQRLHRESWPEKIGRQARGTQSTAVEIARACVCVFVRAPCACAEQDLRTAHRPMIRNTLHITSHNNKYLTLAGWNVLLLLRRVVEYGFWTSLHPVCGSTCVCARM